MKRGTTGRQHVTTAGGEAVRAFIPVPLPPKPPIVFDGAVQRALEPALLALGRLDAISSLLPDTNLFLYTYVRKEAVLSSQIEGTQSSISDLLLYELEGGAGVPKHDVIEVSNYVAAMEHGMRRMRGGFPFSNRLIREIHGVLLARGRGSTKDPGHFRQSQNWIGGTRPGNAKFVPPPAAEVADGMGSLEKFLHEEHGDLPLLIRAGLAHVQFETIHPFLDGNGRIGRLLITLYLCHAGVLREPLLYLSLYLKQHRTTYYKLLNTVRSTGDWEAWLVFYLHGVKETAEAAVTTAQRLRIRYETDRQRILALGRSGGSALRVLEALKERPMTSIQLASARTGLSFPSAGTALALLQQHGIVREITGRPRNRVYVYEKYLAILNEGTEPL
jgi:Fic family protein